MGAFGRSRACNTCRQRRIACSREQPQCAQCFKANLDCGGYHREPRFIVSGCNIFNDGSIPTSNSPVLHTHCEKRLPGRKRGRPRREPTSQSLSFGGLNPVSPNNVYRQQLIGAYVHGFLPTSHFESSDRKPWLSFLSRMPEFPKSLENSLLAVATAATGRINHDSALNRESLRFYVSGLKELQRALGKPSLVYRDETLAACLNLSMYELFECPAGAPRGYLVHQDGCAKLVQLRGPRAHRTGFGHSLFLAVRFFEIQRAIANVRPTFLSDPLWRTIPYEEQPKRDFDSLLDLLSLAPDILINLSRLKNTSSFDSAALPIKAQLCALIDRLKDFYIDFQGTNPAPLYWPMLSTMENPVDDYERGKLFPVAFRFSSLNVARTVVTYWTTLTILSLGLSQLRDRLRSISDTKLFDSEYCPVQLKNLEVELGKSSALDHDLDLLHTIRDICQSIEYFMHEQFHAMGPALAIFPLVCMVKVLQAHPGASRELLWLKGALCCISERGVRSLARFTSLLAAELKDKKDTG